MSKFSMLSPDDQDSLARFQEAAWATAVYPENLSPYGRMYAALGLVGEVGEVADETSKHWRNDHGRVTTERTEKISEELGDAMWYIAAVATEWGLDLGEICEEVLGKLYERMIHENLKHESGGDSRGGEPS